MATAISNHDVLSDIQATLAEPEDNGLTWSSGLWTKDEVYGYLDQRQQRFLRDTFVYVSGMGRSTITSGTLRTDLPDDWIASVRISWRNASGTRVSIHRSDQWEADQALPTWPTSTAARPLLYMDAETPMRTIQLVPPPNATGTLEVLYVGLPNLLGQDAEELVVVADIFVSALKWGVIADMLSKVGRGQDLARAAYAESRYQATVEVARLLLRGQIT